MGVDRLVDDLLIATESFAILLEEENDLLRQRDWQQSALILDAKERSSQLFYRQAESLRQQKGIELSDNDRQKLQEPANRLHAALQENMILLQECEQLAGKMVQIMVNTARSVQSEQVPMQAYGIAALQNRNNRTHGLNNAYTLRKSF
ncbi:MAG: hypothetical protein ACOYK8_05655 [Alphaproteobacteria bacterium]